MFLFRMQASYHLALSLNWRSIHSCSLIDLCCCKIFENRKSFDFLYWFLSGRMEVSEFGKIHLSQKPAYHAASCPTWRNWTIVLYLSYLSVPSLTSYYHWTPSTFEIGFQSKPQFYPSVLLALCPLWGQSETVNPQFPVCAWRLLYS